MKVKDCRGNLANLKVKTPKGVVGYWRSQWNKGVWLSDGKSSKIYPQFVNDLKDCLEWEVTEDAVNCDKKTDMRWIDNCGDEKTKYEQFKNSLGK